MWTACPYASPGKTTFPEESVAAVPATATYGPHPDGPRVSHDGLPARPRRDVLPLHGHAESVARRKGVGSSRRFRRLHLGRRDFWEAWRGRPLRVFQEVRKLLCGRFRDGRRVFPRAELPPAPFLKDLQGLGELAPEGVVGGPVVDRRDDDEFPADRDDPEALVPHRRDRVPPG